MLVDFLKPFQLTLPLDSWTHTQATHPTIEHSDDIAGGHATPECDNWRLTLDLTADNLWNIASDSDAWSWRELRPIAGQCFSSSSSSSSST